MNNHSQHYIHANMRKYYQLFLIILREYRLNGFYRNREIGFIFAHRTHSLFSHMGQEKLKLEQIDNCQTHSNYTHNY